MFPSKLVDSFLSSPAQPPLLSKSFQEKVSQVQRLHFGLTSVLLGEIELVKNAPSLWSRITQQLSHPRPQVFVRLQNAKADWMVATGHLGYHSMNRLGANRGPRVWGPSVPSVHAGKEPAGFGDT